MKKKTNISPGSIPTVFLSKADREIPANDQRYEDLCKRFKSDLADGTLDKFESKLRLVFEHYLK